MTASVLRRVKSANILPNTPTHNNHNRISTFSLSPFDCCFVALTEKGAQPENSLMFCIVISAVLLTVCVFGSTHDTDRRRNGGGWGGGGGVSTVAQFTSFVG